MGPIWIPMRLQLTYLCLCTFCFTAVTRTTIAANTAATTHTTIATLAAIIIIIIFIITSTTATNTFTISIISTNPIASFSYLIRNHGGNLDIVHRRCINEQPPSATILPRRHPAKKPQKCNSSSLSHRCIMTCVNC